VEGTPSSLLPHPAVFITAIPVIPSTTTSPAAVSLLYNRFILFP
jgi:hypothetical protein